MEFVEKDKRLDKMIDRALMSRDKKIKDEFKQWEERAMGKHRQHQF